MPAPWPEFAFAFLDCEFGGLDPDLHDITEIGVIVTDYRLAELASAEWKVLARPERMSAEAGAIFGLRRGALGREGVPVRQALTELAALLPAGQTVVPAGQNVRMDVVFLERAYKACALPLALRLPRDRPRHALLLVVARRGREGARRSRCARPRTGGARAQRHRAPRAGDARLTLETFRHYIGRLALRRPPDDPPAPPS